MAFYQRRFTREEVLEKFQARIAAKKPIIACSAGTGLPARCEEAAGADVIFVTNGGIHRMRGRPSAAAEWALGNANDVMLGIAKDVLTIVKHTPAVAGIYAHDSYKYIDQFVDQCKDMGFVGVTNWPSTGIITGFYREEQLKCGNGYFEEVDMIKYAVSRNMLTMPVSWTVEDCEDMAQANPDAIIVHVGGTGGGFKGCPTMSMEDTIKFIQDCTDAIHAINPDIMVFCHGGPIIYPKDLQTVLDNTKGVVGYYGGSSVERIPIEEAIVSEMQKFTACRFKPVSK